MTRRKAYAMTVQVKAAGGSRAGIEKAHYLAEIVGFVSVVRACDHGYRHSIKALISLKFTRLFGPWPVL